MSKNTKYDLNTILYGPPGTGKTFNTAKIAVEICDGADAPDLDDYDEVMKRYHKLMEEERRICFVTFHQSYGYEEFIEGIKPVMPQEDENESGEQKTNGIEYRVEKGIFKEFCERAEQSVIKPDKFDIPDTASVWKATIRNEVKQDCFDHDRVRIDCEYNSKDAKGFVNEIQKGDIILTTDGSRSVISGIAVVTDIAVEMDTQSDKTSRNVKWLAKNIETNIVELNEKKMLARTTVTKVPSMDGRKIGNLVVTLNTKPYVFIIDEINRGNISKIFGEMITLIEDTKRKGKKECIPAILPYSRKKPFMVPENVYILGTMNTADRSIALMDTALRRRFSFIEMPPKPDLLSEYEVTADNITVNMGEMLAVINKRIERLYDREHMIGHAPFMKMKEEENRTVECLAAIFKKNIIPLLQEYFYEDYEKIRYILGDNAKEKEEDQFIVKKTFKWEAVFLGDDQGDLDIGEFSYEIRYENFENIRCYKGITQKL